MSVECEFSGDENQTTSDSSELKRKILFRYENEGILVYDSSARISDEPIETVQNTKKSIHTRIKKKSSKETDYGNELIRLHSIPANVSLFSSKTVCSRLYSCCSSEYSEVFFKIRKWKPEKSDKTE